MSAKQPETIDEIASILLGTPLEFVHLNNGYQEFKAALSAMLAEIIGEDEDRNHRYNKSWRTEVDAQNYLREQQRQRAIVKGFDMKGGE